MSELEKDNRYHVLSKLMRESLIDKKVMASTETPVVRMLPDVHVVKIGGSSLIDLGAQALYPVTEVIADILKDNRLILGVGGGMRSRHVFSVGLDLGLPTGVLAQIAMADALGNAIFWGPFLRHRGSLQFLLKFLAICCRYSFSPHQGLSSMAFPHTRSGNIHLNLGEFRLIAQMRVALFLESASG